MVVELVAGREGGLEGLTLSIARVLDQEEAHACSPAEVALVVAKGDRDADHSIHVVDLDAAASGKPTNTSAVAAIRQAVNIRIQLGGGARSKAAVDLMLAHGADRVVIGAASLRDWAWVERLITRRDLAGRIALGLDARDGRLAVRGWTEETSETAPEVAQRLTDCPLAAIVYTDIARDGMLVGPNIEATRALAEVSPVPVIASGGVTNIEDVRRLSRLPLGGIIIGRAIYEKQIDLTEAIRVAAGGG